MERKTALYDCHMACGRKMAPFASHSLPVQYKTEVIKEHMVVRTQVGLFDVSHMGEVLFEGSDTLKNINYILTNDFIDMYGGQARYSVMHYEDGGAVDDPTVYRHNQEKYLVVVNAADRERDVNRMKDHLNGDVVFTDISDELSQLAVQSPNADAILKKLTKDGDIPEKYYNFVPEGIVGGIRYIVSQTGYTGESGYELYVNNEDASKLWNMPPEAGEAEGLTPCGLEVRGTLRLEVVMPLYGHEMDAAIHPLETGLKLVVEMRKDNFVGKEVLEKKFVLTRKRVGLRMIGRGIARENEKVYAGDREVGWVTSGTHCPFLGYAIAMVILDLDYTEVGTKVEVEVRGRRIEAEVVVLPFYKKAK